MELKGTGFAKLLLFGEHSAVYGYPALGISLNRTLNITLNKKKGKTPTIIGVSHSLQKETLKFIKTLSCQESPYNTAAEYDYHITSAIPVGGGLGSSGAFCIALAKALLSGIHPWILPTEKEIWYTAHNMEKHFHGTPSGIDTGLALGGGIKKFILEDKNLPVSFPVPQFPFHLVYGTIPRKKTTKELITMIREKKENGEQWVTSSLYRLGQLTDEAINIFQLYENNNIFNLGTLASKAHEHLTKLGLSTSELDTILKTGINLGSPGGKLSGAGGGGAFYLLASSAEMAEAIKEKITAFIDKKCQGGYVYTEFIGIKA